MKTILTLLLLSISASTAFSQSPIGDGMVQIPFVDGKPDPRFVLPNGLTLQDSKEAQQALQDAFSSSDETKKILKEINTLMDKAEAAAMASAVQRRPELKEKLSKYVAYTKAQRGRTTAGKNPALPPAGK